MRTIDQYLKILILEYFFSVGRVEDEEEEIMERKRKAEKEAKRKAAKKSAK